MKKNDVNIQLIYNVYARVCVCGLHVCITGSCHCGKCICNPQDWWVSGEYCECDDRECDKHDGIICTGNEIKKKRDNQSNTVDTIRISKNGKY